MGNIDTTLKAAVAILIVLGGVAYRARHPAFAADGIDLAWDAAAQRSRDLRRPTVVLFTADWCPYCQSLRSNVLSQSQVQDELHKHYGFFTVDLTTPSPQAIAHERKCGVSGIPLLIRYDANGNETDRTNGMSAESMTAWLKAGE
jgi:thiol:disulfide interchange protein